MAQKNLFERLKILQAGYQIHFLSKEYSRDLNLKVRSMKQKVTKSMLRKSFFLHLLFDNLPSFSLKRPMDVFISILEVLYFLSRNQGEDK